MSSGTAPTPDAARRGILSLFTEHWGPPEVQRTTSRNDETVTVYGFRDRSAPGLYRVVTVGASLVKRDDGELASFELFMVLPPDLGGATFTEVSSFVLDVFALGLERDVELSVGYRIAPTALMPAAWPARAILLDEPAGEPEELATFHVEGAHADLLWIVPIYESEYQGIDQHGLDWFYDLEEQSEWSLADPHRPPLDALP
jgi:hypothetical protein